MSDAALLDLAEAAGLAAEWDDYQGVRHRVSLDTLSALLSALELPANTPAQIADSRARVDAESSGSAMPSMITAPAGAVIAVPAQLEGGRRLRVELETGERLDVRVATDAAGRQWLPPINQPGYHRLLMGDAVLPLAVAPQRCFGVEDLAAAQRGGQRPWGIAVQAYSLRTPGDGGIGHFGGLATLARSAAAQGADALAVSPLHALFSADVSHFSPYAPSSRSHLNVLHCDPAAVFGGDVVHSLIDCDDRPALQALEAAALIDWPAAATAKLTLLRKLYRLVAAELDSGVTSRARDFQAFIAAGGEALAGHARFEALHAHRFGADSGQWHWRNWPAALRDPGSREVATFAREHADEVRYHQFLQWLADHGLHAAHAAGRDAGMRIGLIGDCAVGTDSGGSHAWSRPQELLGRVSVGAPPDLLNLQGQNWGLTALSPRALTQFAFAPFLDMLRANLCRVGGLRMDHVLGLRRLWLVPEGAGAGDGAYLRFPFRDLLRLVALESWRHRAIFIGEDLGTVPAGFQDQLAEAGILGIRVLWFERDHGLFIDPQRWSARVMATTSTHDLPTVAGWWQGRDLDWRGKLGQLISADDTRLEYRERAEDRNALWAAFRHTGVVGQKNPPTASAPAVDAAIAFVARTPAPLAMLPIEDILGLPEQPNVPGTTSEHPNWRRRLPGTAASLLESPWAAARLSKVRHEREDG
ncbi:MAG: 4-alpha-glucanotransferase [Porticoccaceae bacterium]